MAFKLYVNSKTDEIFPAHTTFTEQEIFHLFNETSLTSFESIRSKLFKNTWYLWLKQENTTNNNHNYIGSYILGFDIYSSLLIIHDSELPKSWNLNDSSCTLYDDFAYEIEDYLSKIRTEILEDTNEESNNIKIVLKPLGYNNDNAALFIYDINNQPDNLLTDSIEVEGFFIDILDFLDDNEIDMEKDTIAIYNDSNYIIYVYTMQFPLFIQQMMDFFISNENYEQCERINNLNKYIENTTKK